MCALAITIDVLAKADIKLAALSCSIVGKARGVYIAE